MYSYQGIVDMNRWSDSISTEQNDPNTLPCQSSVAYDAHRDPLYVPVTGSIVMVRVNNIFLLGK